MTDFDTTPFEEARADIDALVMQPVRSWMETPPAMRQRRMFAALLMIPLDLGAAGFQVTVTQGEDGWYLELKKPLTPKIRLNLVGQARSYLSALYQLADTAEGAIARLERKARRDHQELREQESEAAA